MPDPTKSRPNLNPNHNDIKKAIAKQQALVSIHIKHRHMCYVCREIHSRQCYSIVFTTLLCQCSAVRRTTWPAANSAVVFVRFASESPFYESPGASANLTTAIKCSTVALLFPLQSYSCRLVTPPTTVNTRLLATDFDGSFGCVRMRKISKKVTKKAKDSAPMKAAYAILEAMCVTDWAGVQPKPQPKPALTDCVLQPHVAHFCRYNGIHCHNPCNWMDYY